MRTTAWKEKCLGQKEAAAIMALPQEYSQPTCSSKYAERTLGEPFYRVLKWELEKGLK